MVFAHLTGVKGIVLHAHRSAYLNEELVDRRVRMSMPRLGFISAILLTLFLGCGTITSDAKRDRFAAAMAELRTLDSVEGHWVGAPPPERGRFYVLSGQFLRYGSPTSYQEMLHDTNALVRVMALVCLAHTERFAFADLAKPYSDDKSRVLLFPGGCVGQETTVGGIVHSIETNRYFLGWVLKTSDER